MTPFQFAAFVFVLLVIVLVIGVLFLVNIHKTLRSIDPSNREMEPGEVFLLLIPLFNYIWMFFVVTRVSSSIKRELESKDLRVENKPAYASGLALAILSAVALFSNYFLFDIFLLTISSIGSFIAFFVYWFAISDYRTKIETAKLKAIANE